MSSTCPRCGAATPPDASFCESCGANLAAATPPAERADRGVQDTSDSAEPGGAAPRGGVGRIARITGLGVVAAALVFGTGYLIGSNAADDSDRVSELEGDLEDAQGDQAALSDDLDDLESENAQLTDDVNDLGEQLDAERNLKPGSTLEGREQARSATVPTDVAIGQAADVADMTLKLTSFERRSASNTSATYVASITVKNNASDSVSPFCGDAEGELIDSQGRKFDGDSVLSESSDNCNDLQPGLTGNYVTEYRIAPDAKPVALRLWGDYEVQDDAKVWSLK